MSNTCLKLLWGSQEEKHSGQYLAPLEKWQRKKPHLPGDSQSQKHPYRGDPDEEHTDKPPPPRRVQERSKGDAACPSASPNPSH